MNKNVIKYFRNKKASSKGGNKMSGHSKWANIQAKKGKTDAARGKAFTKLD